MVKMKNLIKKFGYNGLVEECARQGWRIPTVEEIKANPIEYDTVWVQTPDTVADDRLHTVYEIKTDTVLLMNKSFMIHVAIIVEPQLCINCEHNYNNRGCLKYDFKIPGGAAKFGCTTEFKRKGSKNG